VLTDTWLKGQHRKVRNEPEEFADRDGLSVRLSCKGKIVFQMRFRLSGKLARCSLGVYPKTTLAEARAKNERLRKLLEEEGRDPRVVLQLQKDAVRHADADTLSGLFYDFYAKVAVKQKPAHAEIRRSFEIHVLPRYGTFPSKEVTLHHWLELLEELVVRVPSIADRILTNAKQMLRWAVRRKRLDYNPLADITAKSDLLILKKRAKRALNDDEFVRVWNAVDRSHVRPRNKLYIKLCAIYGSRHTELRKAKKVHVDLLNKIWTVPPENHKTGQKTNEAILRPITPEIEPLFREALAWSPPESELLFPAYGRGTKMRSSQTHLCWSINLTLWLRKHEGYKMDHWSLKALRKTARTNWSTITQPHIGEIMLGHALPGTWGIYDLHDYLAEQASAYSAWCQRIMSLIGTDDLLGYRQWPDLTTFCPRSVSREHLTELGRFVRPRRKLQAPVPCESGVN